MTGPQIESGHSTSRAHVIRITLRREIKHQIQQTAQYKLNQLWHLQYRNYSQQFTWWRLECPRSRLSKASLMLSESSLWVVWKAKSTNMKSELLTVSSTIRIKELQVELIQEHHLRKFPVDRALRHNPHRLRLPDEHVVSSNAWERSLTNASIRTAFSTRSMKLIKDTTLEEKWN